MIASDLRKVAFRGRHPPTQGAVVELQLVTRPRQSVVALPFSAPYFQASRFAALPSGMKADTMFFSRLVVADTEFLLNLVTCTTAELDDILSEEPSLKSFVEIAKNVILIEREMLVGRRQRDGFVSLGDFGSKKLQTPIRPEGLESVDLQTSSVPFSPHSSTSTSLESTAEPNVESFWPTSHSSAASDVAMHVFYQAKDGQNVFLHPLCHRILSTEYSGDYAGAPQLLEGSVREIERHTMDDTLRRRYRFLGHLPLGCEFVFVELDLNGIVAEVTLELFKYEITLREQGRKRRAFASEREDRRIEKQKSEKLRQYFQLSSSSRTPFHVNPPVDSNDFCSFPPISPVDMGPGTPVAPSVTSDGPRSSPLSRSPANASNLPGQWGADVSSYSAATRHMGVFPELNSVLAPSMSAVPEVATPIARTSAVALSQASHVPSVARVSEGSHGVDQEVRCGMSPARSDTADFQSRGAWRAAIRTSPHVQVDQHTSTEVGHGTITTTPRTARRSRRHGGRTTITLLSNAGLTPSQRR
jgi:hypothetical protein